jgi:hypothetical protein
MKEARHGIAVSGFIAKTGCTIGPVFLRKSRCDLADLAHEAARVTCTRKRHTIHTRSLASGFAGLM